MFIATNPERLISKDPGEIMSTPLEEVVRLCDKKVADGPNFAAIYGVFNATNGVNYTAVSKPCFGTFMLGLAAHTLVESWHLPDPYLDWFYGMVGIPAMIALPCSVIGFFSIPLPRQIYPQWHAARRALRYRESYQASLDNTEKGQRTRKHASARKTIPWPPPSWKNRWWTH